MERFKEKIVYITGAARGIGKTIAECFANEGARVIISDINIEEAEKTARELSHFDNQVKAIFADVSKVEDVRRPFDFIRKEYGKLDVLVNNAGIQIRTPSVDFKEEDWDKLMGINLKAVFFGCQEAAKIMFQNGGGRIVNMSSGTSKNPTPGRAPYVISKAGVNAITAVLAAEWVSQNINVNAVAPGWIHTDMVEDGFRLGVVSKKQIYSAVPMMRLASKKEIADSVLYLASNEASYITGHTLFVDGGWSVLGMPQEVDSIE